MSDHYDHQIAQLLTAKENTSARIVRLRLELDALAQSVAAAPRCSDYIRGILTEIGQELSDLHTDLGAISHDLDEVYRRADAQADSEIEG